jgi:hypothetical protein
MALASQQIPSLDLLPVQGIDNSMQTLKSAREKLKTTLLILNSIINSPQGLPADLRLVVNNVRFHVVSGLQLIEDYLFQGNLITDNVLKVKGLHESILNHISELRKAKPVWNQFIATERGDVQAASEMLPGLVPQTSAIDPYAQVKAQQSAESAMESLTKPTPLKTYLTIGGIALGVLLLWKIAS